MENIQRCGLLLLMVASNYAMAGDLYAKMEDAFAEDSHREELCRRSEKIVFCRLGLYTSKSTVEQLDPCLCTHLLLEQRASTPISSLRRFQPSVRLLLTVRGVEFVQQAPQHMPRIRIEEFDGLDVILEEEIDPSLYLAFLKELDGTLRTNRSEEKLLSLTFNGYYPSSSFVSQLIRHFPVYTYSFFSDQNGSNPKDEFHRISKTGVPPNKVLLGLSIESKPPLNQRCSDLTSLLHKPNLELEDSNKTSNAIENLQIKVEYIKRNEAAGISLWNIDDDDVTGVCGRGSYPILRHIQDTINPKPETFEDFADLDIILSTGEAQEKPIWRGLDYSSEGSQEEPIWNVLEIPEQIEKIPCERVGFYRHPSDCTQFYHCSEYRSTKLNHSGPYTGFLYRCPKGLVFDEKQESCIWPSWSEPCQGSGEILPVPPKKFTCHVPGFHVDPDDCRWFYYCSDLGDGRLEAFEFLCPSELLGYDEEKMMCDWKWTVPICSSNNKQARDILNSSYKTNLETAITSRSSKSLKDQEVKDLFVPMVSNSTVTLRTLNTIHHANQRNGTDKNKKYYSANNNSTNQKLRNSTAVTNIRDLNYNPRNDEGNIKAEITNEEFHNLKLNENKNNTEKKYGTAVWRRSWIDSSTHIQMGTISNPNRSHIFGDIKNVDPQFEVKNYNASNKNNLKSHDKNRSVILTDISKEPQRFYRGIVRKIERRTHSFPIEIQEETNSSAKETSNRDQGIDVKYIENDEKEQNIRTAYNNKERIFSAKPEYLPIMTSTPFANVRCSKLVNGENSKEHDEINLGCTSEVSLTIQIKPGKDSEKYILKEDQIKRTAYQESQQIHFIENSSEKGATNHNIKNQFIGSTKLNIIPEARKISDSTVVTPSNEAKKNREFPVISQKSNRTSEIYESEMQRSARKLYIFDSKNSSHSLQDDFRGRIHELNILSSQTDFSDSHEMKNSSYFANKNLEALAEKNGKLAEESSAISTDITDIKVENTKEQNHFHDTKTMPIHFYPQGVLLNIDIAHINEIPPQILLEVDNMLRKYMTDGKIDLDQLEKKLNASQKDMGEKDIMDPSEIMEVIKIIENAIHTSGEQTKPKNINPVNSSENITDGATNYTEIATENTTGEEFEYENITKPAQSTTLNNTLIDKISNNTSVWKTRLINDKIQIADVSKNEQLNATNNQKLFGRKRLLRKFRYPSIREQLQRQNEFQNIYTSLQKSIVSRTNISLPYSSGEYQAKLQNSDQIRAVDFSSSLTLSQLDAAPPEISNIKRKQTAQFGNLNIYNTLRKSTIPSTSISFLHSSGENQAKSQNSDQMTAVDFSSGLRLNQLDGAPPEINNIKSQQIAQFGDRIKAEDGKIFKEQISDYPKLIPHFPSNEGVKTDNQRTQDIRINSYDTSRKAYKISSNPSRSHLQREVEFVTNNSRPNNDINIFSDAVRSDYQYTLPLRTIAVPSTNAPLYQRQFTQINPNGNTAPLRSTPQSGKRQNLDSTKQPGKRKRKLRILVKKVMNSDDSTAELRTIPNDEQNRNIERKIPQNVVKTFKNKLLEKIAKDDTSQLELQIRFQDQVWNIPFVNEQSEADLSPAICTRAGLFQHPRDCTMFYECFWDKWLHRFTLHVFSCPVRLVYDHSVRGCGRPSSDSLCRISTQ